MKLIHSRQHEALYKTVEGFFLTVGYSDGVESIFNDAMAELTNTCQQHSFADIKLAYEEQGDGLSAINLYFLAQAGCSGCKPELHRLLNQFEHERN